MYARYNPIIQTENEEKAHRAFLALYEVVYQRIVQRTVQAKIFPSLTPDHLLSVINNVCKNAVFASSDRDGLFTLVGPFEHVSMVENYIQQQNAQHSHVHHEGKGKSRQYEEREKAGGPVGSVEGGLMSVFEVGGRLTVKVFLEFYVYCLTSNIVSNQQDLMKLYAYSCT